MAQADATIVNVAGPSVHAGLGASGAVLQLVVGRYLIAVAMLLISGARLGQAYGYRRAFVAGVSVFTLASLACGLAPDPAVLVIARILQGAGAGLMFPQTMTGIQLHFTARTGCGPSGGTRWRCRPGRSAARSWAACWRRPTWPAWAGALSS